MKPSDKNDKKTKGRNACAVAAWNRNGAGPMKEKEGRGGSYNLYRELLDEYYEQLTESKQETC